MVAFSGPTGLRYFHSQIVYGKNFEDNCEIEQINQKLFDNYGSHDQIRDPGSVSWSRPVYRLRRERNR